MKNRSMCESQPIQRRALVLAAALIATGRAAAQSRTVSFVSASAPGGLSDVIARLIASQLTARGIPTIVEVKSGGGALIAGEAVARARPNGETFLVANISSNVVTPLLTSARYDPEKDLLPVINFGLVPSYLIVNPKVPVNSIAELISYAKSHKGAISYGSQGPGSSGHMLAEQFKQAAGIPDLVHVPYRGAGPALQDLIAGNIQIFFDLLPASRQQALAGLVRPIAVGSAGRFPDFPNVPTFAEAGFPDLQGGSWFGLAAPAGTSNEMITKMNLEIKRVLSVPDVRSRLTTDGWEISAGTPEEFGDFMAKERKRWAAVIRNGNIKL